MLALPPTAVTPRFLKPPAPALLPDPASSKSESGTLGPLPGGACCPGGGRGGARGEGDQAEKLLSLHSVASGALTRSTCPASQALRVAVKTLPLPLNTSTVKPKWDLNSWPFHRGGFPTCVEEEPRSQRPGPKGPSGLKHPCPCLSQEHRPTPQ